jgi:hypothetical protein
VRVCNAYRAAFRVAITLGDKARAQVFAERAYVARRLISGSDHPNTTILKRLAERPIDHPSYGQGMKCWVDYWEAPQDLVWDEFEEWLWILEY